MNISQRKNKSLGVVEGEIRILIKLSDEWKKIDLPVFLPPGENRRLAFVLFFWKQPNAKAEIRNLKIETN